MPKVMAIIPILGYGLYNYFLKKMNCIYPAKNQDDFA